MLDSTCLVKNSLFRRSIVFIFKQGRVTSLDSISDILLDRRISSIDWGNIWWRMVPLAWLHPHSLLLTETCVCFQCCVIIHFIYRWIFSKGYHKLLKLWYCGEYLLRGWFFFQDSLCQISSLNPKPGDGDTIFIKCSSSFCQIHWQRRLLSNQGVCNWA